jgi:hypothetical protein
MSPAESQSVTAKPRLRWYHCRLRFLLVIVLICSILGLGLFFWVQKERREREVVSRVQYLGGEVHYVSKSKWDPNAVTKPTFEFQSPLLADGYVVSFHAEVTTNLRPGTTDARLARMPFQHLSPLRTLDLAHTNVTDAGLVPLRRLNELLALDLTDGIVTDAGLTKLEGLAQLQWLNLEGTKVTDAGLPHVGRLTQLQWLSLRGTKVTDAGLEHLKGLTQLQWLGLTRTRVSAKGRAKFQQALPKCEIIW